LTFFKANGFLFSNDSDLYDDEYEALKNIELV